MCAKFLLVLLATVVCTGCYHVTVITGTPSGQTVDRPWQQSFVYGLVPPPELTTKEQCPSGIATVATERGFLNGLVSLITYDMFTPMHTTVTCALGPVAK